MATSTEPIDQSPAPDLEEEGGGDRSTRKLLWFLLTLLITGAIALLVLLLWLLRPSPAAAPTAEGGYPIQVVATIYGYGTEQDEAYAAWLEGARAKADVHVLDDGWWGDIG